MIDFEAMAAAIYQQAVAALGGGAELIAGRARHLAPVRHIFDSDRYSIRYKRASEIEADRGIRAQLGLSVEGSLDNPRPRTVRTGRLGQRPAPQWRARRSGHAQKLLAAYDEEMTSRKAGGVPQPTVLDRRGAYEVRTMRAKSSRWGHSYVGGRLRDSIRTIRPTANGAEAEAWVIAGSEEVHYAKYMEFGTRHAAAHPFLRPAAAEYRTEVVSRIAAAIKEASRTGASMDIEIEVRL